MKKNVWMNVLRVTLCVLILANMGLILFFSSQDGKTSGNTSLGVTENVAENTIKDYNSKPQEEKDKIVKELHLPVRKLAHMAEFASLGGLIFALLLTWKRHLWARYLSSVGAAVLFAGIDECSQMLSAGRSAAFTDVLIDGAGALLACTCIFLPILFYRLYQQKKKRSSQEA